MPAHDQTPSAEHGFPTVPQMSPEVSVMWKPLQRLLEYSDGNPISPVTVLCYDIGGKHIPFASLAKTPKHLILWPPFDASTPAEFADGHTFPLHHVSLELANGKTHFTRFDSNGERVHDDHGWKLASLEDGMKLWVIGAFHVPSLHKQLGGFEQNVRMPSTDSERRTDEFKRYAAQMKFVVIKPPEVRGDCLITVIHLSSDASFRGPFKPTHFPMMGSFWKDWIDGWTDGDSFQIAPTSANVDGINLILLTAAPLGHLKGECFIGAVNP